LRERGLRRCIGISIAPSLSTTFLVAGSRGPLTPGGVEGWSPGLPSRLPSALI
jgi:hypothetical protein